MQVTGYVLAGGRSRRMGKDKAFLTSKNGEPLVEHALQRLRATCGEVAILSGPEHSGRDALLSCYGRLVPEGGGESDGPLAALCAALADVRSAYALLLAVDQPGLHEEALRQLVAAAVRSGTSAACFQHGENPEPLPLLVARELGPALAASFRAGKRRLLPTVRDCVAAARGKFFPVQLPDSAAGWFVNLNTPEDLRTWRAGLQQNQSAGNASEEANG